MYIYLEALDSAATSDGASRGVQKVLHRFCAFISIVADFSTNVEATNLWKRNTIFSGNESESASVLY